MTHSVTDQLKAKLDDLRFMEDELEAIKVDLCERDAMVRDLTRDNERLHAQLERAQEKADKLQAYAVNITTRLQIISENVDSVIREASKSAIAEAARLKTRRQEDLKPQPAKIGPKSYISSREQLKAAIEQTQLPQGWVRGDQLPPEPEPQEPEDYAPKTLVNHLNRTRPPINEYR